MIFYKFLFYKAKFNKDLGDFLPKNLGNYGYSKDHLEFESNTVVTPLRIQNIEIEKKRNSLF